MKLLAVDEIKNKAPKSAELRLLPNDVIYAHYGPMRLTIKCVDHNGPNIKLAYNAAYYSFSLLEQTVITSNLFKLENINKINLEKIKEPLLLKMIKSTQIIPEANLTPMAAIAGSIADEIADYTKKFNPTKVIIENGGDLSIYLAKNETAVVGIKKKITAENPELKITLAGNTAQNWGVATSGLGGRGFTLGILDSAVCIAKNGAIADACATAIANKSKINSPNVKCSLAENIFPNTDIKGLSVTVERNTLNKEEIEKSLKQALNYSEELIEKKIIIGTIISLNNKIKYTNNFFNNISKIEEV